jgi:hypothetical protein
MFDSIEVKEGLNNGVINVMNGEDEVGRIIVKKSRVYKVML